MSREVDYHDFTDIDTSQEERSRLDIGNIYSNSAKCLECDDVIRSRNRHDYVTCKCENLSIDGGSWYVRISSKNLDNIELLTKPYNDVKEESNE